MFGNKIFELSRISCQKKKKNVNEIAKTAAIKKVKMCVNLFNNRATGITSII